MRRGVILGLVLVIAAMLGIGGFWFWGGGSGSERERDYKKIEDILDSGENESGEISGGQEEEDIVEIKWQLYEGQAVEEAGSDLIRAQFSDEVLENYKSELKYWSGKLKQDLTDVEGWMKVGQLKKIFDNYEGARDAWEYAKYLNPNQAAVYFNLGDLYGFYIHNREEAEINYLKALELAGKESSYYIAAADFYRTFDNKKAEEVMKRGLDKINNDFDLLVYAGAFYKSIGNKAEAVKFYERAFIINPENKEVKEEIERLEIN